MKFSSLCAAFAGVTMLVSCGAPKKVPYIEGAEYIPAELLAQPVAPANPIVQSGDILNIEVSGLNYAAIAPFNKGNYVNHEGNVQQINRHTSSGSGNSAEKSTDYYLVDKDGNITFPIIGSLHVAGLTKTQIAELIQGEIYPKYVKEMPVVDIRFMNFRVTVLGAVGSPGILTSENERLNILEAIAMAGDLNIKADRENIILLRTNTNGSREIHRLNVHDKNILFSPYYNLQPNDMLIVNWNPSGAQNAWSMSNKFTSTVAVVGGLSAVIGLTLSIISLTEK